VSGLGERLGDARVVVVVGPGGVGKTTTSAAVALRLAEGGRRTIVLTVDPAHRLATALGLPEIPGDPVPIRTGGSATLEGMQLDTKRTLDGLVGRHASNDEQRDRILSNPIYQRIADTLAGTHEYMAMEKLYELATESDHEAIVIDTPPTRSALSFLDAPHRMTDFIGGRFLRWILGPSAAAGRGTLRATSMGAKAFAQAMRRITGAEVLADLTEFLASFQGMYQGFKERAAHVLELMRQQTTRFVVVTAPEPGALEEAGFFAERLRESELPLAAVVANRAHIGRPRLPDEAADVAKHLEDGSADDRALAAAIRVRLAWQEVEAREEGALARFRQDHDDIAVLPVPEIEGEVNDLKGLRKLGTALFEPSGEASPAEAKAR
jgi:anion-transporting  ArsA/GET3 family ATPase